MRIDWVAVATIAAPIIALLVAGWLDRRRTRLIAYYSHVAGISGTFPGATQAVQVNTHTLVLRNTGHQAATNVRLHHATLPLFSIWPQVPYNVETLPNGSQDIVIPNLIPGEQLTISYLYFPPLTYDQINQGIKCDQGFAHAIPVLLQRQWPRWVNRLAQFFLLAGVGVVAYFVYRAARCAFLSCALLP
jgi:hypothetical protein